MKLLRESLPLELPERFDKETVDAAKGLLILLVIFGHATNFWTPEPFATFSVKFFHVACFLLLTFIYDVKPLSMAYAKDRFAKYYVPFLCFLILYGVLYLLAIRGIDEAMPWLIDIAKAMIFGNAPMLDNASGLRALWFMPALISIVLLNAFFVGTLKKPIWILMIFGLFLHLVVGAFEAPLKYYFPFGLVSVLYLLWLGFVVRSICSYISRNRLQKLSPLFLMLALCAIACAYDLDTLIKFPVIALPDYSTLHALLIHDIIILSMFLFLITTPFFKGFKSLRWCGQNSMIIYLSHLLFLAACMQITTKVFDTSSVTYETMIVVLWIFTMALSGGVACALLLNKFERLQLWVTPRSWSDWPPLGKCKK